MFIYFVDPIGFFTLLSRLLYVLRTTFLSSLLGNINVIIYYESSDEYQYYYLLRIVCVSSIPVTPRCRRPRGVTSRISRVLGFRRD